MIPVWTNRYTRGCTFQDCGRDYPKVDCWGLVRLIYAEQYGIELPSFDEQYRDTSCGDEIEAFIQHEEANWWGIARGDEREGDAVLMRMTYKRDGKTLPAVCHIGLVVTPGVMIHCERGIGVVVDKYLSPRWGRRITAFYRHEELIEE